MPSLQTAIRGAKDQLTKVKDHKVQASTFANTILALETAFEQTDFISTIFHNLLGANSTEEMHALSADISGALSELGNDLVLDHEIFARVQYVYDHPPAGLSQEELKILDNTYVEFKRGGALLDDQAKATLRTIDQELSRLSPRFLENTLKATNSFILHIEKDSELKGLKSHVLQQARKEAEQRGLKSGYVLTLQGPTYQAIMQECSNRSVRQKMYMGMMTRAFGGEFDNRELVHRMIELKEQRSQLLGYENHATYVLERRMAETPAKVMEFLNGLLKVVKPAAEKDIAEIRKYAEAHAQISDLQPWDWQYFSERMKEEALDLDPEILRPYFPLETVLSGTFEIAHRLFGLRFLEAKNYPVYHNEVRVFEVKDNTGAFVGLFYCDFFPRPSKQSGAWMTNFLQQGLFRGKVERPHVSIVCNFPAPVGGEPSLLTLRDVRTLLHEFGHGLHSLLSNVKYRSLSGTQVLWDFVELPSQFMENWISEKESLALLARHYKTGETLPETYVAKIKSANRFHAGMGALRQLSFGFLDMALHTTPASEWKDIEKFERTVMASSTVLSPPTDVSMSTSFGHIFSGGYSAGYYSYKWAEVLEADAFAYFQEQGLFNREVAKKYYENILSRGGTEHPKDLYKKFRGREPEITALLKRDGFIS